MPLAHDFFDPLVMRDTCLVAAVLIDRGTPFSQLIVEAMKHLEGPLQFAVMNLYCLAIRDAFPLTPATMQFPNTVLGFVAAIFAFLLLRRLFDARIAYFGTIAFALTPWLAFVLRLTQYFNTLALMFHFAAAYFLVRLMSEPKSHLFRLLVPISLAAYVFSSLDWPSYLFFFALLCIFSGNWLQVLRNPYKIILVIAFVVLLAWDALLYFKFGAQGLGHTRFLYAFTVSSTGHSFATLGTILEHEVMGWGPLMAFAFGGLAFYILRGRRTLYTERITVSFLDACGLWLVWATVIVFLAGGHRTHMYVVGMPAAVFSGLVFSRIPLRAAVGLIAALSIFQIGVVTDWGYGLKTDQKRRVLAAACFLIENRPDLVSSDKTILAVDSRRYGEKGLGGAVAQYARPQNMPIIFADYFVVSGLTGRGLRPGGKDELDEIVETYNRTGVLKADGVILESAAVDESNPAAPFWKRLLKDPNIRWIARFREQGGEILVGEIAVGKGLPATDAPLIDVKPLSDKYLEKYDRFSFLKRNLEHARLYFTSVLSK